MQAPTYPLFPLRRSDNGRYFVTPRGQPFFVQGEAAWSAIVNLTAPNQATYLDNAIANGFNTVMVSLIEHQFSSQSPAWRNANGDLPFSGTAFQSSTVTAYFDAAVAFIRLAYARGIAVSIAPLYLGFGGGAEGWQSDIEAASAAQAQNWGAFVGGLLANEPNVIYQMFGDYNPPDHARTNSARTGISGADGAHQLFGSHYGPNVASHDDAESWLTWDYCYQYGGYVHDQILAGYNTATTRPVLLGEAWYELENSSTSLDIRRQAWGAVLSGACGQYYGHRDIWGFGAGLFQVGTWQDAINNVGGVSPARVQMGYLRGFIEARKWWKWVPDQSSAFITAGRGTFASTSYVTATFATDGCFGCAYLPTGSTGGAITVAQSRFASRFNWTWFNPRTGGTSGGANNVANSGSAGFTAPDTNDWVWVGWVP